MPSCGSSSSGLGWQAAASVTRKSNRSFWAAGPAAAVGPVAAADAFPEVPERALGEQEKVFFQPAQHHWACLCDAFWDTCNSESRTRPGMILLEHQYILILSRLC